MEMDEEKALESLKINSGLKPKRFFIFWIAGTIILALAVLYIFIIAIGLYFFNWRMGFVKKTAKIVPYPAAWVNVFPVTFGEVFKEEAHALKFYQQTSAGSIPKESTIEKNTIELLIKYRVIQKLASKYHLSVSAKEVNETLAKLYEENGGKKSFEQILLQFYGYKPGEINNLIYLSLMQEKLVSYYDDNLLKKVHLNHIIISDETKAKEILERAKKEDFSKLAKEFSEDDATKNKGGDLGFFAYSELAKVIIKGDKLDTNLYKDFRGKIWSAKDNQVFLFNTDRGWQIVKVVNFKGSEEKTFEDWFNEKAKKTWVWRLV